MPGPVPAYTLVGPAELVGLVLLDGLDVVADPDVLDDDALVAAPPAGPRLQPAAATTEAEQRSGEEGTAGGAGRQGHEKVLRMVFSRGAGWTG